MAYWSNDRLRWTEGLNASIEGAEPVEDAKAGDKGKEKGMKQKGLLIVASAAATMGMGSGLEGGLRLVSLAAAEPGTLSVEATKHMVKECRQQHENVANTVDEVLVELDAAQRSHDAARTRAVLELAQMRLADLKQDMALCTNLMNMIDRRTSEHETTQREHEMTGRDQETKPRDQETNQSDQETNRVDPSKGEVAQ